MSVMFKFRIIYRNPIVEYVLLGGMLVQIITGISVYKKLPYRKGNIVDKLQIISGLYILFYLITHISIVFLGRKVFHMDTNFYFAAAGLNTFPSNLFFIPFYFLGVTSIFVHIACVHYKRGAVFFSQRIVNMQALAFGALGPLVGFLILFGITNGFKGREIPEDYRISKVRR
jgi:hypothetical protein